MILITTQHQFDMQTIYANGFLFGYDPREGERDYRYVVAIGVDETYVIRTEGCTSYRDLETALGISPSIAEVNDHLALNGGGKITGAMKIETVDLNTRSEFERVPEELIAQICSLLLAKR